MPLEHLHMYIQYVRTTYCNVCYRGKPQSVVKRVGGDFLPRRNGKTKRCGRGLTEAVMSGSLDGLGIALNVNKLDPDYINPGK